MTDRTALRNTISIILLLLALMGAGAAGILYGWAYALAVLGAYKIIELTGLDPGDWPFYDVAPEEEEEEEEEEEIVLDLPHRYWTFEHVHGQNCGHAEELPFTREVAFVNTAGTARIETMDAPRIGRFENSCALTTVPTVLGSSGISMSRSEWPCQRYPEKTHGLVDRYWVDTETYKGGDPVVDRWADGLDLGSLEEADY